MIVVVMVVSKWPSYCNFFGLLLVQWGLPQSPDCWNSCIVWGKIGAGGGGIECDSGIVIEDVCEDGM